MSKIEIFVKIQNFCKNSKFLSKIQIFVENPIFGYKSKFSPKNVFSKFVVQNLCHKFVVQNLCHKIEYCRFLWSKKNIFVKFFVEIIRQAIRGGDFIPKCIRKHWRKRHHMVFQFNRPKKFLHQLALIMFTN